MVTSSCLEDRIEPEISSAKLGNFQRLSRPRVPGQTSRHLAVPPHDPLHQWPMMLLTAMWSCLVEKVHIRSVIRGSLPVARGQTLRRVPGPPHDLQRRWLMTLLTDMCSSSAGPLTGSGCLVILGDFLAAHGQVLQPVAAPPHELQQRWLLMLLMAM